MTARCAEVLSPSPEPPRGKFLRIVERVEGFFLLRFDERGESLGDLQFETMDEPMHHVYSEYHEISVGGFATMTQTAGLRRGLYLGSAEVLGIREPSAAR
jgi:hypothetical protein